MVKKFPEIPCPKCGKFGLVSLSDRNLGEGDVVCTASGCELTISDEKKAFDDFAAKGTKTMKEAAMDKNRFGS